MIVTSNRALSEWPERFGNPLLASAGLDRLFDPAHGITITGDSYRARSRQLVWPGPEGGRKGEDMRDPPHSYSPGLRHRYSPERPSFRAGISL